MKILPLVASIALSSQLMAFKPVTINKFNINYSSPSGLASADFFSFDGKSFSQPKINVEREESSLRLSFLDDDIVFEDLSDDLLNARPFQLTNLNARASSNKASLSAASMRFKTFKSEASARNFIMVCDGATNQSEEADKYLESCTRNSVINLNQLSFKSNGAETKLSDFRMQSQNNRLLFSVNVGLKASGEGRIRFISNSSEKKVEIKIDKVKAGFFTVTGKFFDALKDLPDNIEVRRPYIIVHLDK